MKPMNRDLFFEYTPAMLDFRSKISSLAEDVRNLYCRLAEVSCKRALHGMEIRILRLTPVDLRSPEVNFEELTDDFRRMDHEEVLIKEMIHLAEDELDRMTMGFDSFMMFSPGDPGGPAIAVSDHLASILRKYLPSVNIAVRPDLDHGPV